MPGVASTVKRITVMKLDNDGFAMGDAADPNNIATGGGSVTLHGSIYDHIVSAAASEISRRTQEAVWGGSSQGKFDLGIESIGEFDIEMGYSDETMNQVLGDVGVNTSAMSGYKLGGHDFAIDTPTQVAVLIESIHQEVTLAGFSQQRKHKLYIGTMSKGDEGANAEGGTNPVPSVYTFTPQRFRVLPNGIALLTHHASYAGQGMGAYDWIGSYSLAVTTWICDGTDVSFNTEYQLASGDVAVGGANYFTREGVAEPLTSVNESTGLITPSGGAGTAGQRCVLIYPTTLIPVA